jgi:Tol biopolymer transport system component
VAVRAAVGRGRRPGIDSRFRLAYALLVVVAGACLAGAALLVTSASGPRRVAGACDPAAARLRQAPAGGSTGGLYEVGASGGPARPIAVSSRLDHPVYSPDGRRIALLTDVNGVTGRIAICDLARGTTSRLSAGLAAGDLPLSWLPDGKSLVFLGGDLIGYGTSQHPTLVDVRTGRARPLAGEAPWYWDTAVASPDGKQLGLLLQLKYGDGEPERLDVFDARTQKLERIAGSTQFAEIDALSWSPDGRKIVFSAYKHNARGDLYVADVATKKVSLLLGQAAGQRDPAWSPDGKRIAFVRPARGGGTSIWSVDLAGGRVTRLTSGHVDVAPSWSRDGRTVVFVRRGGKPGPGRT